MIPMNGKKLSARDLRRKLNAESRLLGNEVIPAVQQLLHNEQIARDKITDLEAWRDKHNAMTLWQRLRWLAKGTE